MPSGKVFAKVYTPKTPCASWKDVIRSAIGPCPSPEQNPRVPYELEVIFFFQRPKSHPKKNPPERHTTKPDGDNAWKAVADCLKELGWVYDDSQISDEIGRKRYDPAPGAQIILRKISDIG